MATGVKPRDEDTQLTRTDLEVIQDAMKNKKFRELLAEYCEEVRDPANQALYQKEMTQLEKERGYDVTFINPKGGYVIKTSVAGDRKAFINICSNDNVGKPSYTVQDRNGKRGMNWQIPYSLIPPREDYDHKKEKCVIYDVVYHPDTLRMAEVNKQFRELVNKTAIEGLQKTYNINLDMNNFRFPKSYYKGMMTPAVIRKEDPKYIPPNREESDEYSEEILDKLYPQHSYSQTTPDPSPSLHEHQEQQGKKVHRTKQFTNITDNGYTVPKYVIKHQKSVDIQEYTFHKNSKQYSAIPNHIIVEINLPLLSSAKECVLDIEEKTLSLLVEKPAKYKLNILLPYSVNDELGNAKFDKTKRILTVTLPVMKENLANANNNSIKVDSGIDSECNSGPQSDEENNCKTNLIEELSSKTVSELLQSAANNLSVTEDVFLDTSLGYQLPVYTCNALDDIVAFTFHVKNTEPNSVKVKNIDSKVYIKFTSVGSGFVPVHYAAIVIFDDHVNFENISGEAWDNNVILQLELTGDVPKKCQIGLSEDSMTTEYFDISQVKKMSKENGTSGEEVVTPVVEVTNLGCETNIVVSSNLDDQDEEDIESPVFEEKEVVWIDSNNYENGAKSILRKPMTMMRSFSESSVGDVASSMDYISSDCIPEESSLKKTVRFNDVIARQFYRYNSSIEGQKKKNQRKKSKKRNQDRRKSESEAEDDISPSEKTSKSRLKSSLKQRRDSGLADTSDPETECKGTPEYAFSDIGFGNENSVKSMLEVKCDKENSEPALWVSDGIKSGQVQEKTKKQHAVTCETIKHNSEFYNPDRLNKGQYPEVSFKNDLIFDLDM